MSNTSPISDIEIFSQLENEVKDSLFCEFIVKEDIARNHSHGAPVCGREDVTHVIICSVCQQESSFLCAEHAEVLLKFVDAFKTMDQAGWFGRLMGKGLKKLISFRERNCGHKNDPSTLIIRPV